MSQPWLKFYPRDWRGDQALRAVSIAARGLWMEVLCIMHEASPYGHLVLGGLAVSNDVLARMSGLGAAECGELLAELESAGVFSRTRKGVIYSRRMIKDRSRAEKGRKSVQKRWAQGADNLAENSTPNRFPNREPTTQKPETRSHRKRGDKPLSARAIPDWLPLEAWAGYREMRTKTKKPLTDRAATMALRRLSELRDQGHDPGTVLDQSTLHCWQDLYPIRPERVETYDRDRITV
jgi:hypothetical protein